ncbi:MAG: hypothetical protein HRT50_00995 [Colwellia sp.]|uniref:hypothetical protein n=1 Tax=Colwellia sp. TaxID=56799 RepID=UPI001D2A35DD|nr:hypothetical protein [Colwellia sp.]NQY47680.1 hypothetical protein [Colwellia sp.]
MNLQFLATIATVCLLSACTAGKLYYTDDSGHLVLACDVEFVGLPSVDKFAVEYALSLCAKSVVRKGHKLGNEQKYLLKIDTSIPAAPCGKFWDHELAKNEYQDGQLSKREYGYLVAHIDLGLAVVEQCSPDMQINQDK